MEFIKELVETQDSERMKSVKLPFGNYEDMGFRMLKQVEISNEIGLSIQASYGHYCTPRKTLPLEDYRTMELAIFKDHEFVNVEQVTSDEELISKFEEFYEGTVYGYVPVELIEMLYQNLTVTS